MLELNKCLHLNMLSQAVQQMFVDSDDQKKDLFCLFYFNKHNFQKFQKSQTRTSDIALGEKNPHF